MASGLRSVLHGQTVGASYRSSRTHPYTINQHHPTRDFYPFASPPLMIPDHPATPSQPSSLIIPYHPAYPSPTPPSQSPGVPSPSLLILCLQLFHPHASIPITPSSLSITHPPPSPIPSASPSLRHITAETTDGTGYDLISVTW